MTDAEFEQQKARVGVIADKWLDELGLNWWSTRFQWHRESPVAEHNEGVRFCIACRCHADWQYLEATIQVYLPELEDLTDERIERIMVHEFCHMLVNELRDVSDDWLKHEERVCTTLATAFLWVRDAGKEGKL